MKRAWGPVYADVGGALGSVVEADELEGVGRIAVPLEEILDVELVLRAAAMDFEKQPITQLSW